MTKEKQVKFAAGVAHTHNIDAAGRSLGRVATEAAKALMGKTLSNYTPNKRSDVRVTISNASKLITREKKSIQKTYQNYSGYPGGHRIETLRSLNARKGYGAALRLAITRMLPRNTMRVARLKNLTIEE
jgi:large subunit ribosomal protein L13